MEKAFIFTIATVFFILTGCEVPVPTEEDTPLEHQTEEVIHNMLRGDLEILVIDNCQYLVYKEAEGANLAYGFMAHKGNCNNPIHCYNVIDSTINSLNSTDTITGPTE